MKKVFSVLISLILILSCVFPVFAARLYEVDGQTGEIVDTGTGETATTVTISSSRYYDKQLKKYVYEIGQLNSTSIYSNVYDGMIVTSSVTIERKGTDKIEVYKNGELIDEAKYASISEPGAYVVTRANKGETIFSFRIVNQKTCAIDRYRVPEIFYISAATLDNETVKTVGNDIDLSKDGTYSITYKSKRSDIAVYLDLEIDHTPPELEIIGLDEDGIARGPVSFGQLEPNSTLLVYIDGQQVIDVYHDEYTQAGTYSIKYIDDAGNVSSYYFVMHVFLNWGAWVFVIIAAAVIIAVIVYVIYSRKNIRVR